MRSDPLSTTNTRYTILSLNNAHGSNLKIYYNPFLHAEFVDLLPSIHIRLKNLKQKYFINMTSMKFHDTFTQHSFKHNTNFMKYTYYNTPWKNASIMIQYQIL